MTTEPRSNQLFFDPDQHPEDTLKAFEDFIKIFHLRYEAQYPDPPKVSLEAALQRWKVAQTSDQNPDPKPTVDQYDKICIEWRDKDKVKKLLGIFSSHKLYEDWCIAEPDEVKRMNVRWPEFIRALKAYYKPTENTTLKHFHFRTITQLADETFPRFCNRVEAEAKHCDFKCDSGNCTAENTAIRDQILIGTNNCDIRDEALKQSWKLSELRQEGMKMESAARSGAQISNESSLNRIGKYSYSHMKKGLESRNTRNEEKQTSINCYNCGGKVAGSISKHKKQCSARTHTCGKCAKKGHFDSVCRSSKVINMLDTEGDAVRHTSPSQLTLEGAAERHTSPSMLSSRGGAERHTGPSTLSSQSVAERHTGPSMFSSQGGAERHTGPFNEANQNEEDLYSINLFRIKSCIDKARPQLKKPKDTDFTVQVIVNNNLDRVVADTGARISVCGTTQAKKWGLLDKMVPSKIRIKPYNSEPIAVYGEARCAVTFGTSSIPVVWHIISGSCEPILSGNAALQLGIIQFRKTEDTFQPILMIEKGHKGNLQGILAEYPQNFQGLGKLKDYKVKLHCNPDVKPVNVPAHSFPYHLKDRAQAAIDEMIKQDVIEEHPRDEPAPWVSNAVLAPKADGSIRVTLDARNVNKAILSSNIPIPKQEDIKAKLAGAKIFSKMDLKSAFWQIELEENSRHLTVFHANGKLYRYKRLTMGLAPSQGELTVALRPVFADIEGAHIIHDDLVVGTATDEQHEKAIRECMEALAKAGLTLNPPKCVFGKKEISFWGMIFSAEGTRPDPEKVEALEYITAPTTKEELISFLCMMQSNADFISNFSQKSATLRELTKGQIHFKWQNKHQQCFDDLIKEFKKDTLLRYFDMSKPIYVFSDAHISGLGAMLGQGDDLNSIKPVAFASRTTSKAESRYPQIDLEAMGLDFGLRRFRNYLVGAPNTVKLITDHKPLLPVFNGKRKGSIRSEKIKMRHQDINFELIFQKGKLNQTDFISRRGKPIEKIPKPEQEELNDLNNLLYMLHTTPIVDHISLAVISKETENDSTLKQLSEIIKSGKTWLPPNCSTDLKKFKEILPEITLTNNRILLKSERIILPESLQKKAIELTHRGSHPGQCGIERRLRFHFFFHGMREKVEQFVRNCIECMAFSNKRITEPIHSHKVPKRCWESVAVDLFGPMPSNEHVVVVQDMASRFPAAKLVSTTNSKHVLPALGEIYNNYGNPNIQLSDNGPPFNSADMERFAEKRNIQLQKIPPLHPEANPAETFMKPLGKTMKIAHETKTNKGEALQHLLQNYRDTPHPATALPPGSMMFRHGYRTTLPRVSVNSHQVDQARLRDQEQKKEREAKVNASKFRKATPIDIGDTVMLRNFNKKRKFDPNFSKDTFKVIAKSKENTVITVAREIDGMIFKRHPNDIKIVHNPSDDKAERIMTEFEEIQMFHKQFAMLPDTEESDLHNIFIDSLPMHTNDSETSSPTASEPQTLRRSERTRKPNSRYFNEEFVA